MAARLARTLRLHTFPGQVLFLSTISIAGGWGITQLGDDDSRYKPSRNTRTGTMQQGKGDLVDAIQSGSGSGNRISGSGGGGGGGPTLADALTAERGASLWWGYARDSRDVTERLTSRSKNSTLLVPVDKAILALKQKPHQYSGSSSATSSITSFFSGSNDSQSNIEKFLRAHMIDGTSQPGKVRTMLEGFSFQMNQDQSMKKEKGQGWRIQPGDIEVLGVKETSNGRIMYINKVLPY
ncbi:hypothetical protein I302_100557 [Kwoniella bestiolae CBS 10118]|uniref:FAS1 domain-containing protein n=1 Tax=Kwoniella bestiolae CBS 10118 TaxID=1296100 RepID=A0A1B9G5H5_9TREE|nr:hypothetical protein I302_03932 [Kwoniella bestiolae CBS 10118]OCF26252.1 hypothetical protein I302_03932 [Kwoniella bestiolae CBS 10118]